MANEPTGRAVEGIETKIHLLRGQRVMLDWDLARISGLSTKRLTEQYRRNRSRFPKDFTFQLTRQEVVNLRSQSATSSSHGGRRYAPIAFTEHGAILLASVLNSPVAVEASVRVVRAFVYLREQLVTNRELRAKPAQLEGRVGQHDEVIQGLFEAIRQLLEPPAPEKRREIGFHARELSPCLQS